MNIDNTSTKQGIIILGFFFLFISIIGVWQFYKDKGVEKYGVYAKCKVIDVLGYKGGVRIDIEYVFKKTNMCR